MRMAFQVLKQQGDLHCNTTTFLLLRTYIVFLSLFFLIQMSRKKNGREGLLVWLQSRTCGYNNVNIVDFTDSWVDGTY